jgi:hypothetical protein
MASSHYSAVGEKAPSSATTSQQMASSSDSTNDELGEKRRPSSSHKRRKRRPSSRSGRLTLWEKIKEPILECSRCGERYFVSWKEDRRCPKCGRRPPKIQAWQFVLSALFFPAAIAIALFHRRTSPRNSAITFFCGLAGAVVESAVFLFARSI